MHFKFWEDRKWEVEKKKIEVSIEKWHLKCEQEVALKVWVSIKNINAQIPCKRRPKLSLHATYPKCQITASFSGSLRKNLIDTLLKRSTHDSKRFTVRLCIVTTRLSIEPKAFLALVYLLFQVCLRRKFKYYSIDKNSIKTVCLQVGHGCVAKDVCLLS